MGGCEAGDVWAPKGSGGETSCFAVAGETGKAVRRSRGAHFEFHSLFSMKVPAAAYSTCALEVPKVLPRQGGLGRHPAPGNVVVPAFT